jgi:hypothetical protein
MAARSLMQVLGVTLLLATGASAVHAQPFDIAVVRVTAAASSSALAPPQRSTSSVRSATERVAPVATPVASIVALALLLLGGIVAERWLREHHL